jgi:hypothetical protein
VERSLNEVYKYLWGDEFLNVWESDHWLMMTEVILRNKHYHLLDHLLNSNMGTNIFLSLTVHERMEYVKSAFKSLSNVPEVLEALTKKYYAPLTLMLLINRDNYMRITDFTYFNKALEATTLNDLEELSLVQSNEETFMQFLKHIEILDEANE